MCTHLILLVTQKALCSRRWLLCCCCLHHHTGGGVTLARAWKRKCVSGRFFWFFNPTSVHLNLDEVAPERRPRGISTISYEIWASTQLTIQTLLGTLISKHLHLFQFQKNKFSSIPSLLDLRHDCLRSSQGSDEGQRPCRLSEPDFYSFGQERVSIWQRWWCWFGDN